MENLLLYVALVAYLYGAARFAMKTKNGKKGLILPFLIFTLGCYYMTPDYVGGEKILVMLFFITLVMLSRCFFQKVTEKASI